MLYLYFAYVFLYLRYISPVQSSLDNQPPSAPSSRRSSLSRLIGDDRYDPDMDRFLDLREVLKIDVIDTGAGISPVSLLYVFFSVISSFSLPSSNDKN